MRGKFRGRATVNSPNESFYRLELAKGYLTDAESDTKDKRWDKCLGNSQEAIENAGKSILTHFRPAPHTHDIVELLKNYCKTKMCRKRLKEKFAQDWMIFETWAWMFISAQLMETKKRRYRLGI